MTPTSSPLRAQWEKITIRPPVVAELHPGGPDSDWLSISLSEPNESRSWLHFRKVSLYLQCAFGDDETKPAALGWDVVDGLEEARAVMLDFAENFEESPSAHSVPTDE